VRHRDLKMFVPPLADLAAMGAKVKELQEAPAERDGRAA
jgi:hypothetical protein